MRPAGTPSAVVKQHEAPILMTRQSTEPAEANHTCPARSSANDAT